MNYNDGDDSRDVLEQFKTAVYIRTLDISSRHTPYARCIGTTFRVHSDMCSPCLPDTSSPQPPPGHGNQHRSVKYPHVPVDAVTPMLTSYTEAWA